MTRYLRIWLTMTSRITEIAFASRLGVVFFTVGKILRFVFFLIFLLILSSRIEEVAGYTLWQIILFYLTFNLIDVLTQFLFREVYRFRSYIVSGSFDYILTKPISPLFRCLLGGSDILDLFILAPLLIFIGITLSILGSSFVEITTYVFLMFSAMVIATAFHIIVLSLGVLTTEVDNAIWMFRDITQLGRIPVTMYSEPLSWVLTFVIPVAAMITIPAQAALGIVSFQGFIIAFSFSSVMLLASLALWRHALTKYASASS